MHKSFDVIQLIGAKACAWTGEVTQFVLGEPACHSKAETWTMGFIVVASVVLTLAVLAVAQWRKRRQTSYL